MLSDLVRANRSYRSFDPARPVTEAELLSLISLARLCPSANNRQFLRYAPIWTPDGMAKVLPCTKWAAALPELHLPPAGHEPPAAIILCHDTTVADDVRASARDVGIAAQTILLGATERGLGGCMIGNFRPDALAATLGLDAHLVPVLVVALGRPDETVVLEDAQNGAVAYYRDAQNVHHVPKRPLEEIVI